MSSFIAAMRPSLSSNFGSGKLDSNRSILSMDLLSSLLSDEDYQDMLTSLMKTGGGSSRSLRSINLPAPAPMLQHEENDVVELEFQSDVSEDDEALLPQQIVTEGHDHHRIDQVIFKIGRLSTGDSVVPLDEDIRMSSSEWWTMDIRMTDETPENNMRRTDEMHPSQQFNDNNATSAPSSAHYDLPSTAPTFDEYQVPIHPIGYRPSSSIHKSSVCVNERTSIESFKPMNEHMALSSSSWVEEEDLAHDDSLGRVPFTVFSESAPQDEKVPQGEKEKKRKRPPRRISSDSVEHTVHDILFGRGAATNRHPGNVRFRNEALRLRPWYESVDSDTEKYEISMVLIETMKNEQRRFLKKGSDGMWHEVDDDGARTKASQLLRERIRTSL